MRRYLTIGITKTGLAEIVHGPEKPFTEHRDAFRALGAGKKKDAPKGFAEIQVIDISRGIVKRKRYGTAKFKGEADGKRTVARTVPPPDRPAPRVRKPKLKAPDKAAADKAAADKAAADKAAADKAAADKAAADKAAADKATADKGADEGSFGPRL